MNYELRITNYELRTWQVLYSGGKYTIDEHSFTILILYILYIHVNYFFC